MESTGAGVRLPPPRTEVDVQLLAWAVSNCHTLARREINRLEKGGALLQMIERWQHVLRICEKAGARSKGVLRASLPTEITEGSARPASLEAKKELVTMEQEIGEMHWSNGWM